ncbi:MAG: hypothetical protein F6K42_04305 [Leptolyngbya sp. SIO1D8]|nr:hypothetical protein [Leptolyngbya sp. SIO1D8]
MKRLIPLSLIAIVSLSGCTLLNSSTETTESANQEADSLVASNDEAEGSDSSEPDGVVLVSTDGSSQLTIPEDWSETTDLNDVAILQAANPVKEQYVIVIQDSKEDFTDANLEYHSEVTAELLIEGLTSPEVTEPRSLTINNYPALQKEISGAFDNINVVYLHTSIETPTHFYQVLTWSLKSRFEGNRSTFEQVTQSFREADS